MKDFMKQSNKEATIDHGSHEHHLSKDDDSVTHLSIHKDSESDFEEEDHGLYREDDDDDETSHHRNSSFTISRDWYTRINSIAKQKKQEEKGHESKHSNLKKGSSKSSSHKLQHQ